MNTRDRGCSSIHGDLHDSDFRFISFGQKEYSFVRNIVYGNELALFESPPSKTSPCHESDKFLTIY